MGFGTLSSASISQQIGAVDDFLALVRLMDDVEAAKARIAEYSQATAELRQAHEQLQASQAAAVAAERSSGNKLAAARAEHEAALEKAQTEFDARRLRQETALAAREKRVAEMEVKVAADAEANTVLRGELNKRLRLIKEAAA